MAHYYTHDIAAARAMPTYQAYELFAALPLIEHRRHVHTATLMALVEAIAGGKSFDPTRWLYAWAQTESDEQETASSNLESETVLRDMAMARKTRPFSAAELARWHNKYGERIHELMATLETLEV